MNAMLRDKLANFSRALARLEEAARVKGRGLAMDGTIQRFEFTFETAWKALRKFLLIEGHDCASPRECLKKAFQAGYLEREKEWLEMLQDRNLSSHVYKEAEARRIHKRVVTRHLRALNALEAILKAKVRTL